MNQSNNIQLVKILEKKAKKQSWTTTFADMMTLLLCFFVLLFSFSNTDQKRFDKVSESFTKAFGNYPSRTFIPIESADSIVKMETGNSLVGTRQYNTKTDASEPDPSDGNSSASVLTTLSKALQQHLSDSALKPGIELKLSDNTLIIRLDSSIAYASGSGYLQPKAEDYIRQMAAFLVEFPGNITVVGHTDNLPVVNDLYRNNVDLSLARAQAVAEVLSSKLSERTVSISGKGDSEPIASNETQDGRAKNRRVEILVTHGKPTKKHLKLTPGAKKE